MRLRQQAATPRRIVIIGWLGALNLGDEMMLHAALRSIDTSFHEVTLIVHRASKDVTAYYSSCKVVERSLLSDEMIENLATTHDALLVNGGTLVDDYLYDQEAPRTLARDIARLGRSFVEHSRKVAVYGVSTNVELTNPNLINDYGFLMAQADSFSVRDGFSKAELLRNVSDIDIPVVHDLVMTDTVATDTWRMPKTSKKISIIPIFLDTTFARVEDMVNKIIDATPPTTAIELVLFYDEDCNDMLFASRLIDSLDITRKQRIRSVVIPRDSAELYTYLATSEVVVSMRYHGTLYAGMMKKRVLAIDFDEHRHYINKNQYLRDNYSIGTVSIKFSDIDNMSTEDIAHSINAAVATDIDVRKVQQEAQNQYNKVVNIILSGTT